MRALDIESVLCLADRTPLGRVEEVRFSPYIDTNKILFRSSGCCWLSLPSESHDFTGTT